MVCQLVSQLVLPGYLYTQFEIVYMIAGMPVLVMNKQTRKINSTGILCSSDVQKDWVYLLHLLHVRLPLGYT